MARSAKVLFVAGLAVSAAGCESSTGVVPVTERAPVRATTTAPVTTRPADPYYPPASPQDPSASPPPAPSGALPGGAVVPSRPSGGQTGQGNLLQNILSALGGGPDGSGGNNGNNNGTGPQPLPQPSSPPGGNGDNYALCMKTINDYRATVGSPPLTLNSAKNACSDEQTGKDGQTGSAHANFGECGEMAQDECPGWGDGDQATALTGCLRMMWDEGPGGGHYENMKNASYRSVACGFKMVNGSLWMVQNFYP